MSALTSLRERLAELSDISAIAMLVEWDQLVMMPSAGGPARAQQLGTLARLSHERATAEEIGEWLSELEGAELSELDRDIVRLARRDWTRARKVPDELAAELARASTDGQESWQRARGADDFAAFAPALEHNVRLAREYAACLVQDGERPYDALLSDFDFGLRSEQLRRVFAELAAALTPLVAEASAHSPRSSLEVPIAAQEAAVTSTLRRLGVDQSSWRVDVSTHPFTAWVGTGDSRVTTRYGDGEVESLLSSLHEYGHALYERQIDPALERTNLGTGTSMSIHESQSKLWENHVARNPAFCRCSHRELSAGGFAVAPADLHAALVGVEPTLSAFPPTR